jgi:hypothetical protein
MDFLFHSVFDDGHHSKYFNVYKIDGNRFLAQCHHFNRARDCDSDFEIIKDGESWKSTDEKYEDVANYIGEELERFGKV